MNYVIKMNYLIIMNYVIIPNCTLIKLINTTYNDAYRLKTLIQTITIYKFSAKIKNTTINIIIIYTTVNKK